MADSETSAYNALSYNEKRAYDRAKTDHPDWSHSQLTMYAKVNGNIEKGIGDGRNVETTDVLRDILKQARSWLEDFADISLTVLAALDEAISNLGRAIANGVRWIGNTIGGFLEWLFN